MNKLTLRTKTFILIGALVLLTTGPLVAYYLSAARSISALGTDPQIENSLSRCIDLSPGKNEKIAAAGALKKYGQIKVLKNRIVGQVIMFSIVYSIALIALALGIGYLLIARITRPLKELTMATRKIAEDKLDKKLPEDEGGEIGELIRAFNRMTDDLKTAREQRAIAERRATWQHVARTIAHEIKNPLTPIKLSTERMYEKYLLESADFGEVIKSTTTTILSEIANLQKLVDTFHRYAKFPDPVLSDERLEPIVRETAALFSSPALPVTCRIEEGLPVLRIDKGQIREALANLVKNGIEACDGLARKGVVEIALFRGKSAVVLSVTDNGCGIPEENRVRLFQPYFTTKKQGSGIGLALIERIVTLHSAKIAVESDVNRGTDIKIFFPLNQA
jgi:two-component system, NtrC family, nitrogen regulation sensor histidine kinase NtrY